MILYIVDIDNFISFHFVVIVISLKTSFSIILCVSTVGKLQKKITIDVDPNENFNRKNLFHPF